VHHILHRCRYPSPSPILSQTPAPFKAKSLLWKPPERKLELTNFSLPGGHFSFRARSCSASPLRAAERKKKKAPPKKNRDRDIRIEPPTKNSDVLPPSQGKTNNGSSSRNKPPRTKYWGKRHPTMESLRTRPPKNSEMDRKPVQRAVPHRKPTDKISARVLQGKNRRTGEDVPSPRVRPNKAPSLLKSRAWGIWDNVTERGITQEGYSNPGGL